MRNLDSLGRTCNLVGMPAPVFSSGRTELVHAMYRSASLQLVGQTCVHSKMARRTLWRLGSAEMPGTRRTGEEEGGRGMSGWRLRFVVEFLWLSNASDIDPFDHDDLDAEG